jgi:hypothetical protein
MCHCVRDVGRLKSASAGTPQKRHYTVLMQNFRDEQLDEMDIRAKQQLC